MARARKKRTAYSLEQRRTILDAAVQAGLTAIQVRRKYGVTPVTYYSWRRKYGVARGRGGAVFNARLRAGTRIETQVRSEVKNRVRAILPEIVRTEVNQYLDSLFRSRRLSTR